MFARADYLNPGGSIKDRVALAMLEAAQVDGKLSEDSIIAEPTSGNIATVLPDRADGYFSTALF
ncbi:MAG: hypothetical protein JSW27_16890 [Phycisphaerales bacterium]|nr:MAG: hypothetical protein JSW27_16890 [Phycisphaerales bacterium]